MNIFFFTFGCDEGGCCSYVVLHGGCVRYGNVVGVFVSVCSVVLYKGVECELPVGEVVFELFVNVVEVFCCVC